ncbi:SH3 domain-containing protein [Chondromyces apiculatus]|uniref:SH3b domain-containing protein n=1 Tax=Chondromyces apiculatus DSM 436 TaxID=1192034 RepID=A0A017STW7_9BACT|nr:SH3 domain-containing protein [Chondromyces apiculatus]EYF00428.1 Hypothetical protein CAP_0835 [Chondromyces apiculatus DSM 436]
MSDPATRHSTGNEDGFDPEDPSAQHPANGGPVIPGPLDPLPAALAPPAPLVQVSPPPPTRQGSLKPILVICALAVVSAALCAAVILYSRGQFGGGAAQGTTEDAETGRPAEEEKRTALPGEAMPPVITEGAGSPGGSTSSSGTKTVRAVVTLPEGQPRAVLRNKPDFNGDMVVFLPQGATVEVTNSTTAAGGTWFRVRTLDTPTQASGWVHGAVLKM